VASTVADARGIVLDISFFVEDYAHEEIVGELALRIAGSRVIRPSWHQTVGGFGAVRSELRRYLRGLAAGAHPLPDLIVVATDANCRGRNERIQELRAESSPAPVVHAVPDPHIERWLLLDGQAFRRVRGRGCDAPDRKCNRHRYKEYLIHAVLEAGVRPVIAGTEYARDIIREMDLDRAARADDSFRRFRSDLSAEFRKLGEQADRIRQE